MKATAPPPHQRLTPGGGRTPAPRSPARLDAAGLALQRAVGNRVARRVLARWTAHPDSDKKGVMVPDVVADEFVRFNPPANA